MTKKIRKVLCDKIGALTELAEAAPKSQALRKIY